MNNRAMSGDQGKKEEARTEEEGQARKGNEGGGQATTDERKEERMIATVGDRLTMYWPDEDAWFEGTIVL
jgi:hypothetical protein